VSDSRRLVLFLDDDPARHSAFRLAVPPWWDVTGAHSADHACILLGGQTRYDAVFLDHDLCEEDVMSVPGLPTRKPTGMAVVDHIVAMLEPPPSVVVHTMNPPAAEEMCRRLAATRRIIVQRLPFHLLLKQLELRSPEAPCP